MRILPLLLVCVFSLLSSTTAFRRRYACGVCEAMVDEMNIAIADTMAEKDHLVQTKWRIDEKRKIPYARTEHHLLEILETKMTGKLEKYGIDNAGTGTNGHIMIRKSDGVDSANFVLNKDVTGDIKETYEHILEEHMEAITLSFHKDVPEIKSHVCQTITKYCRVKKPKSDADKKKKKRRKRRVVEEEPAPATTTTTETTEQAPTTPETVTGTEQQPPTGTTETNTVSATPVETPVDTPVETVPVDVAATAPTHAEL